MGFPTRLLVPGEEVLLETCPNWSVLVRPVAVSLLTFGACAALLVEWGSAPTAVAYVVLAVILAAIAFLGACVASWRSRLLVITTTRVIYRFGFVHRTGREIPLERIQDVTFHQSLLERLVGAGSLTVESAGREGQEPFPDVRHPAEVQSLINQLCSRTGRANLLGALSPYSPVERRERVDVTATMPPVSSDATLRQRLIELERSHELGLLSDDEFARKRRQLLGLEDH